MGLIVLALVAILLACSRSIVAWITGVPAPELTLRPKPRAAIFRFIEGIGKVAPRERVGAAVSPQRIERLRVAGHRFRRPGDAHGVLVVGAGPSGLLMAALLHRCGVHVRIIDRNDGPARESRAFAVQARTIELFRNLGLADELLGLGVINTRIQFHIRGRSVGGLDFDRSRADDSPYQFILMAPQNEVEALLLSDLAARGVHVERQTELLSLTQTDGLVTARLRTAAATHEATCSHIVGADGAHSAVRKQIGLSFEGGKYAQKFLLADCQVDWPFDHTEFRIFMNGRRIGLFLPLQGSAVSRVMAADLDGDRDDTAGTSASTSPIDLKDLQDSLSKAMAVPIRLSRPVWLTRYQVHLRGVETYRVGRAFLVGDAAHIHSPAGGQGMNTGLQDAANLAWKIALSQRTGSSPQLLDSYDAERFAVGKQVLRFTDRLYKVAADLTGWRAWLRDTLGPFVIGRASAAPLPHRKAFRRLSQIGLRYPASAINANGTLYSMAGPLAGTRAPDARIRAHRQMFDLLTGYRLHVVVLSRRHLKTDEITEHDAQLRSIAGFDDRIATHLVARVECRRDARVEQAESVEVFERYGLKDDDAQALFVIRPDGYVAWRTDDIDFDACRTHLAALHGGFGAYEAARIHSALSN